MFDKKEEKYLLSDFNSRMSIVERQKLYTFNFVRMKESEKGIVRKTVFQGENSNHDRYRPIRLFEFLCSYRRAECTPVSRIDIFDCFRFYTRLLLLVSYPLRVSR